MPISGKTVALWRAVTVLPFHLLPAQRGFASEMRLPVLRKPTLACAATSDVMGHFRTMCIAAKEDGLFDRLVGSRDQRLRNAEAERLCGLEIDYQLEPSGLLNW